MNRKTIPLLAAVAFKSSPISILALGISAGAALMPATAHGQIFVTYLNFPYPGASPSGGIGEYSFDGMTVSASLVPGVPTPYGIAVSGSDLFTTNLYNGLGNEAVGEYTTSGATVNSSLVSLPVGTMWIAVSGTDLFVGNRNSASIAEYTTSGATVNGSLISGLNGPQGIAVSGSDLFIANSSGTTIGEYTTSGGTVNASLISGLNSPCGIAVSGSDLFVANNSSGTIGEYTTSGATVNASLISGLNGPLGIAISGSDLFVVNGTTIGEYTTSGATVNASLVSGLNGPCGIAVAGSASVAWNNTGGTSPSDGNTWDIGTNNNWNDGSVTTVYTDGSYVTFNDSNNGNYAVTLNTTVSPGSVIVNNSSGNYTISGTGSIAGNGSLTKTGSGTLTVSTVNTYSGGTSLFAGTLSIPSISALGSGGLTWTAGTLQINSGNFDIGVSGPVGSSLSLPSSKALVAGFGVTVDPGSALSLQGGSLTVNAGATLNNGGTFSQTSGTLTENGAFINSGTATFGGTQSWGPGSVFVNLAGTATFNSPINPGGIGPIIDITGGNVIYSGGAGSLPSTLNGLSITALGKFDLTNTHIFINYGSGPDPIISIRNYLIAGYNGGAWNGPGIISAVAQTPTNGLLYGVGYADGADGVVAGLSSGQIEVMYTLLGDANLDGLVNAADFTILAANFNQTVTSWDQGDFNYDGLVNAADFTDLAANFNQSVSGAAVSAGDVAALDAFATANGLPMPAFANVPDPASFGLLTLAGLGMLNRRSRRDGELRFSN